MPGSPVLAPSRSSNQDRAHVLLQRARDRGCVPHGVSSFRSGDREKRRGRGGGNEPGAANALVIHDDTQARAEFAR